MKVSIISLLLSLKYRCWRLHVKKVMNLYKFFHGSNQRSSAADADCLYFTDIGLLSLLQKISELSSNTDVNSVFTKELLCLIQFGPLKHLVSKYLNQSLTGKFKPASFLMNTSPGKIALFWAAFSKSCSPNLIFI